MKFRTLLLLVAAATSLAGADKAPSWLTEMATREIPDYDSDVPAVVLFEEERASVDPSGVVTTTVRKAIKVLKRAGRGYARGSVIYSTDSGKVRSLNGWLIYPSGKVESYGKKETVDVSLADNDIYNESRVKAISARNEADPGVVFGYESVSEDRSIFTQFSYRFQSSIPALTSRFAVSLPPGWTAESVTFNHEPLEPTIQGSTYSWQLNHLPPIEDEPAQPSFAALTPRVAVSYFPSASAGSLGPVFREWSDVSTWLSGLNDPQASPDAAIAAKAKELTSSATSELERISAIARYAQDVNYVSIQTGIGRGGGYRPHAASEVFEKSYGDCKDKSNLMRAMLDSLGIAAYPVAIYSGDRNYVRDDWASPQQFNHAIIAVSVSDEVDAPATLDHERFGRLLFFDPTDPYTPPGQLPDHEQESWALLVAPEGGGLVKMPSTEPQDNRLERTAQVQLSADGSITAELREQSVGESAVSNRALYERRSAPEYRKLIERWVTNGASAASVSKVEAADADDRFTLDVAFSAPGYARTMGTHLLMFKPAVVSRRDGFGLTDDERKYPVVLNSNAFDETVEIQLPAGFGVDEKPTDVELTHDFGAYSASWTESDDKLVFKRKLELRNATVPVDRYAEVRDFFRQMTAAEQAPVVLVRR